MKRYVLGIAGFIGSGKSTVAKYFEEYGAYFIDADQIVHQLYEPEAEGFKRINNFFGDEYRTKKGELNRKKLAKVVFSDPKKLKILHALIHPLVTTEIQKLIDRSNKKFIVLEATYFEKKFLQKLVNAILWVDSPKMLAYQRLAKNRKLDREMFEKIYRLQVRPTKIDFTIHNNKSTPDLKKQVAKIYRQIKPATL